MCSAWNPAIPTVCRFASEDSLTIINRFHMPAALKPTLGREVALHCRVALDVPNVLTDVFLDGARLTCRKIGGTDAEFSLDLP